MPSPIAHGSLLFLAPPIAADDRAARHRWYAAVLIALLAPDVDFAFRTLADHGGPGHSFVAAVLFAPFFAIAARACRVPGAWTVLFSLGFLGPALHILLDMLTWGRGVMALWPFSHDRIHGPALFYGVRHSEPLAFGKHLVTITTELVFAAVIWGVGRLWRGGKERP